MSPSKPPPSDERPLRVEQVLDILPRAPELRPLRELLTATSRPDPEQRWTASGALGTVGERLVQPREVTEGAPELARAEARRLAELYRSAAGAVEALASGRVGDAVAHLVDQGAAEEAAGRVREAGDWYRAAHSVARSADSPRAPEALRRAARADRSVGDLDGAARGYEDAFREAETRQLPDDQVVAAIGRGNVAVDRGRWDEAEAWYRRALDVIGSDGPQRSERWQIFQNLAIVHRRRGELDDARRALEAAEEEAGVLDDPDAEVEVVNGWGQLLLAEDDPRGAELHFRRALSAAGDPKARVTVRVNLGEALLARGRTLEAAGAAREAEADAVVHRVVAKLPEVYRLLAAVARHRNEPEAFVLLERALELIREHGLPPFEEALTLEAYAETRADDDPDAATEALERAARIYRELGMDGRARALPGRDREPIEKPDGDSPGGPDGPSRSEDEETTP